MGDDRWEEGFDEGFANAIHVLKLAHKLEVNHIDADFILQKEVDKLKCVKKCTYQNLPRPGESK